MAVHSAGRWSACLLAISFPALWMMPGAALGQSLPSDAFLSRAAVERAQPPLLGAPARALRVATLDWPHAIFDATSEVNADDAYAFPPPLVLNSNPQMASAVAAEVGAQVGAADEPLIFGPPPASDFAYAELALDIVMSLPNMDNLAGETAEMEPTLFGPDFDGMESAALGPGLLPEPDASEPTEEDLRRLSRQDMDGAGLLTLDIDIAPLYHDPRVVFGADERRFPALAFEYAALPARLTLVPLPASAPLRERDALLEPIGPSPAARLGLDGPPRARAEKCLAEAIYFESRGETKRGQIAVAQVVINRVFSGYYPNDVCKTVYQNSERRNACQFTFACDYVKDVIREPDMWVQAKQIAADMLDGKLWLEGVGRATHYHAYWVRPSWVREMRKLDRIGVHTFYRPKRWTAEDANL